MTPRIGAYVLAADPTWLRSSLLRYRHLLDRAVISVAADGRGWTGAPIPSLACAERAREILPQARDVTGSWVDETDPVRADTAQRRDALGALGSDLDWVLQIDTDEVLPDPDALLAALAEADHRGLEAVEWPMRSLFSRLRDGRYLEARAEDGSPRFDYPGPIAVRPGTPLTECRRTSVGLLRPLVVGDQSSLQIQRPPEPNEVRLPLLDVDQAILHNTWARDPRSVRRKIRSWGHRRGLVDWWYYATVWRVAPLRWRTLTDLHPFASGLWPRLGPVDTDVEALLHPADRRPRR